jgi:hypothetical protein
MYDNLGKMRIRFPIMLRELPPRHVLPMSAQIRNPISTIIGSSGILVGFVPDHSRPLHMPGLAMAGRGAFRGTT